MFIKKSLKTLVLVVLVLALSGFTYAFAAVNTMPVDTKAGDGSAPISGYDVTNIVYNLNPSTPTLIASVSFKLNAAATTAYIKLNSAWYLCDITGGTDVNCVMTGVVAVSTAATLQVVAAN